MPRRLNRQMDGITLAARRNVSRSGGRGAMWGSLREHRQQTLWLDRPLFLPIT
ncbi:hypothetical protein [Cobetia amphilecti]|uniref:hypothetical protein n=1 Tax=Cobetia amphilecti TaxID=1055104 RepID=UPI001C085132|nr:hypothetical protein [Cobetia amphilecti]MBU3007866.1 hypothetical protein [Cobetia amphilecti]